MRRNVLLKLGGSVVTYKNSRDFPLDPVEIWTSAHRFMNLQAIRMISLQIKESLPDLGYLIMIHGAGVFGHFPVGRYLESTSSERELVGWPFTMYSVQLENLLLLREMLKCGIPVVGIPPRSIFTITARDKVRPWVGIDASLEVEKIRRFLGHYVPVLFGDLVADQAGKPAVLSGDTILYLCARELRDVNLAIAGTDVEGIFTDDPKTNPKAKLLRTIALRDEKRIITGESSAQDVDGGMKLKFKELASVARLGVTSMVINALGDGNISRALRCEKIGTLIEP